MFSEIKSQLKALGRSEQHPWAIIKVNSTNPYAYNLVEDTLYKLRTWGGFSEGGEDNRERFQNGCLKYFFAEKWGDGAARLQRFAEQGDEIFLIPNYFPLEPKGENGIGADFVSFAPALFAEIDDLSIPEQWQKIEEIKATLGLEASMVVFSGGKSLHIYFCLSDPFTDLSAWKKLQQKLICLLKSDPAIANSNREMRLAGVVRKSKGSNQSLELLTDRDYTSEEIESLLDSSGLFPYGMDDERFRKWRREIREGGTGAVALTLSPEELNPQPRRERRKEREVEIDPNNTDRFPLELCLSREHQELIVSGVADQRNESGFRLAKDLIGTAQWLDAEGFSYEGDPYDLFIDYCQSCPSHGGWDSREWEMLWRQATRGQSTPSVPPDGILKRISYWQWEQNGCPRKDDGYQKALEAKYGKEISPEKGKRDRAVLAIKDALEDIKQTAIDFLNREDIKAQRQDPVILVPVKNEETSERNYEAGKLEETRGAVIYDALQRKQVWSEAVAKGYKIILDRSATGQGKSYTASQLNLTNFDFGGEEGQGQLIFFLGEPDNPSVPLDAWHRIPTLNENNCHKWQERRALAAKGLGRSSGKGKHDSNPICNSCPFLSKCREGSGDGYGFKSQMQEALAVAKAYGHPAGFPRRKNDGAIAIYDEFESLVKPSKSRSISLKQLSRIFLALEQRDYVKEAMGEGDSLYSDLIFIKEYLEPYLSGAKETPRYGIDLAEMQKIRPDWDEEKISQIISLVDEFEGELAKNNLKSLTADSSSEDIDRIVDMPFLGDLIAILLGHNSGALRLQQEKLLITTPNTDAIAQVKSFKTSLLLDATCTKQDLVRWYGIKPEEILECRQERTPTPKFKIIQLTGAGLNTSQRSEAGKERKQTILSELNKIYGNGGDNKIGVIDYKSHSDEGDLHHFRSGEEGARGSNRFQHLHAIAAIGCPYIAVNAILDEYQAISGEIVSGDRAQEDEGFTQYYESKIQKEIIQEVGRLRANLRPESPLTFFLINDIDPSFLTELGIEVARQPIWHTVESLRPRSIQKLEGLASFFAELASSGLHLSQAKMKDAADSLKVANSDLSRLTKKVGGWFSLREKINNLFKETKEAVNFSHWQWEEFIKTKLGELYSIDLLDSPQKLCDAIEQHGWQAFSEYFTALDIGSKATAIANLLYIIFGDRGEWITNLKDFCLEDLGLSESQIRLSPPLE